MDDVLKVSTSYILERVNYYDLPLYEFAVHLFEQQAQFFPQWRLWVIFMTVVSHNKVKKTLYFHFYIFNYFIHGPNVWQPQIFSTLRRIVASRRSDLKLIGNFVNLKTKEPKSAVYHKMIQSKCGDDNVQSGNGQNIIRVDPCLKLFHGCPIMISTNDHKKDWGGQRNNSQI